MSPIALRGLVRRARRHTASAALILVLVGAVAVHHATPALGDPHHAAGVAAFTELCLGVFTAVGVAAVAAAALFSVRRLQPSRVVVPADGRWPIWIPEPRTRAGPAALALLCVSRR